MEPFFTGVVRVSVARDPHSTTEVVTRQYVELRQRGTTILREFTKYTLMKGHSSQIAASISELLITFCGPISRWRLPKDLNLLILELGDIAKVGVRSLRFTINNSPRSERIFMWNSKRYGKTLQALQTEER